MCFSSPLRYTFTCVFSNVIHFQNLEIARYSTNSIYPFLYLPQCFIQVKLLPKLGELGSPVDQERHWTGKRLA